MRHTEFWSRMEAALGESYARFWAEHTVLTDLDGRTASEALELGESPKRVWVAVHRACELPESMR